MNSERFPEMSKGIWEQVRDKFKQVIPKTVNESYIRTITGRAESYSRNVVQNLKVIKLINNSGEPTERARKLRNDAQYAEVCKEIIRDVYPEELIQHGYSASQLREIQDWFLLTYGLSENTARKKAAFYRVLLSEIDHNELLESEDVETPVLDGSEKKVDTTIQEPNQKNLVLTVRMEVNLPAGGDQETYDNIFKSIKENLLND